MRPSLSRIALFLLVVNLATVVVPDAISSTEIANKAQLQSMLGLGSLLQRAKPESIRIAILDNGFDGAGLPDSAERIENYPEAFIRRHGLSPELPGNPLARTKHGLSMAQIVWAMTGQNPQGPKFFLLNANGFTQFKRAVFYAIEQKVDIILYSQVWEFGGHFDGKGFINAVVSKATDAGILWVNAAGNSGGMVANTELSGAETLLRFENRFDENPVTLTVSWNDFGESEEYLPVQDLDIEVLNSEGKVVAVGNRAQVKNQVNNGLVREPSQYAREKVSLLLDRGVYRIRIKKIAGNFIPADGRSVRVRAVLQTDRPQEGLKFLDGTSGGEVLIPADHPQVITVGDVSTASAKGPTTDGRSKPDFLLPNSEVQFTSGLVSSGSSNAAALFAGMVAVLKSIYPAQIDRQWFSQLGQVGSGNDLTLECLVKADPVVFSEKVIQALEWATGIQRSEFLFAKDQAGRKAIALPKEPILLGTLYEGARNYLRTWSMAPESLRYFIRPVATGRSNFLGVETYFIPRASLLQLPATFSNDWIEIGAIARAKPRCGVQTQMWVMPQFF